MKRLLLFLFFLVVCLNLSFAYEYQTEVDGIIYKLDETDKEALVYGFNSSLPPNVEIPSEIIYKEGSYKVSVIRNYAFYDCPLLESIVISEGVKVIGEAAFRDCSSLVSVWMSESVSDIGKSAFADCKLLSSVNISNNVGSIRQELFKNCVSLETIEIPDNVTSIGVSAFQGCSSLSSIDISSSVKEICQFAFSDCKSITTINIPNNVTSIKDSFNGCSSLTNFIIEDGGETLYMSGGNSTFGDTNINELYLGRDLYINGSSPFSGCKTLTKVVIGNCVPRLYSSLFADCSSLETVIIKAGGVLRSLGSPFGSCPLKELYLGRRLEYAVFNSPFKYQSLSKVTIGNKVSSISEDDFQYSSIKNLIIEDGSSSLDIEDTSSPLNKLNLKELYLGRKLKYYSDYPPFSNQINLNKVTIGTGMSELGKNLFQGCANITKVVISKDLPIHYTAFEDNVYRNAILTINNDINLVLDINKSNWTDFQKVIFEDNDKQYLPIYWTNIMECPEAYFSDNRGCLVSLDTDEVTVYANGTSKLLAFFRGIEISDSLSDKNSFRFEPEYSWRTNEFLILYPKEDINARYVEVEEAGELFNVVGFENIQSIEFLTIKGNLNGKDFQTINRMSSLKYLNIEDANIVYGCLNIYTNDNCLLENYFKDNENLMVIITPKSLKEIGRNAFTASLKFILLHNQLTHIGRYAFNGCKSLVSIEIPGSVEYIGSDAFDGCKNLENLIIKDSDKRLDISSSQLFKETSLKNLYIGRNLQIYSDDSPFKNNTTLSHIEFGNYVNKIEDTQFSGCESLHSISIPLGIDSIGSSAFRDCTSLVSILIQSDKITELRDYIFQGCSSLSSIDIPNSVTSIGNNAFDGCSSLSSIDIPNNVTSIGNHAFYGCSSLSSIDIPNSVDTVGEGAFGSCTSITSVIIEDGKSYLTFNGSYSQFKDCGLKEVYLGRNLKYETTNSPFSTQPDLCEITIGDQVLYLETAAFEKCSSLKSILIPNGVVSIGADAFNSCIALDSIDLPQSLQKIGDRAFCDCSSLREIILHKKISKIGKSAFRDCYSLKKIKSLNPTPPYVYDTTFDGVNKKNCKLIVTKGSLTDYWLDLYWKDFMNISDDMLALDPIPDARYGDASVDLAKYSPEGVKFMYESSNNNVARIDGTKLTICGAGEASVSASLEEEGTPMEIIGQIRTFKVDKADLTLTARSYEITQGDLIPDFLIDFTGFVYDDDSSCIEELPEIVCSALDSSLDGEYEISLIGGKDSNYNMGLVPGTLVIKKQSGIHPDMNEQFSCKLEDGNFIIKGLNHDMPVSIYDVNGLLLFQKQASEEGTIIFHPEKQGIYIVTTGFTTFKIIL